MKMLPFGGNSLLGKNCVFKKTSHFKKMSTPLKNGKKEKNCYALQSIGITQIFITQCI